MSDRLTYSDAQHEADGSLTIFARHDDGSVTAYHGCIVTGYTCVEPATPQDEADGIAVQVQAERMSPSFVKMLFNVED